MTRGYIWFKAENMPPFAINEWVPTGGQLNISDYPYRNAHSRIKLLGQSENESFKKYFVEHETQRSVKHRVDDDIKEVLIEILEFHLFESKAGYFFADTKLEYLRELVGRIGETYPQNLITFQKRIVDLIKLKKTVDEGPGGTEISGGHFRNLAINKVSAASIFGHDVGDSELWDELSDKGQLTGVHLNFEFDSIPVSIMITVHGGIVTYSQYTEKLALELLEEISNFIEPFSTLENLSALRRRT